MEEENARKAEAHRLQMEREAEIHATRMAKMNAPATGQGELNASESRLITLSLITKDLEL